MERLRASPPTPGCRWAPAWAVSRPSAGPTAAARQCGRHPGEQHGPARRAGLGRRGRRSTTDSSSRAPPYDHELQEVHLLRRGREHPVAAGHLDTGLAPLFTTAVPGEHDVGRDPHPGVHGHRPATPTPIRPSAGEVRLPGRGLLGHDGRRGLRRIPRPAIYNVPASSCSGTRPTLVLSGHRRPRLLDRIRRSLRSPPDVPQPPVTSTLSQNSPATASTPAVGNYTTSATDADIPVVGPSLRSRGTTTPWTRGSPARSARPGPRARRQGGRAQAVPRQSWRSPIRTGPRPGFGDNADGTFTPPSGRFALFKALSPAATA